MSVRTLSGAAFLWDIKLNGVRLGGMKTLDAFRNHLIPIKQNLPRI